MKTYTKGQAAIELGVTTTAMYIAMKAAGIMNNKHRPAAQYLENGDFILTAAGKRMSPTSTHAVPFMITEKGLETIRKTKPKPPLTTDNRLDCQRCNKETRKEELTTDDDGKRLCPACVTDKENNTILAAWPAPEKPNQQRALR
jgi:hypothetical protein